MFRYSKYIILLSFLTAGCTIGTNRNIEEKTNITNDLIKTNIIETIVIRDRCQNNNIQKYIDDGWIIDISETKKVACTWKKAKTTPNCKPKKDKGCLITVPDTYGEMIIYTLKKDIKSKN